MGFVACQGSMGDRRMTVYTAEYRTRDGHTGMVYGRDCEEIAKKLRLIGDIVWYALDCEERG